MSTYHGSDQQGVAPRRRLLKSLERALLKHLKRRNIKIDDVYLIGTGNSGVAMCSVLSYMLGCRWGFVRKHTDTDHHSCGIRETNCMKNTDYIVAVDDFVSSGRTMARLREEVGIDAILTGHRMRKLIDSMDLCGHPSLHGIYRITPKLRYIIGRK